MSLLADLQQQLQTLKSQIAYRTLSSHKGISTSLDFTSNDYLRLSKHPLLIKKASSMLHKYGMGSTGSRLLSGHHFLFEHLEQLTASFVNKESSLVFNSGFQLNSGVIPALYGKPDLICADKLCHASIIDGFRLSQSIFKRYHHCNTNHLIYILEKLRGKARHCLVVTESVFSMDGDRAPLEDIQDICQHYDAELMVDEAHALGVFGEKGSGCIEKLEKKPEFIVGTFGKSCGSFGAFLACDYTIKDYLINHCRSFIYTTALPLPVIAFNIAALELLPDLSQQRRHLLETAKYFRTILRDSNKFLMNDILGNSHIVPLRLGSNSAVTFSRDYLKNKHIAVSVIRHPTVAKHQERLRFSVHSGITKENCDYVIENLL